MKKIKILIADSDIESRNRIVSMLDTEGSFDLVAELDSGRAVLDKMAKTPVDIVLMEARMPEMDGLEATRQITANYPMTNVILMSVFDDIEHMRRALRSGAKEYMVKPFFEDEIKQTIIFLYNNRRKQLQMRSTEATDISLNKREAAPPIPETKSGDNRIVTVFGTKGGIGKSVICANLAVAAGEMFSGGVALADFDIQFGDLALIMDLQPRKTLAELMQENRELDTVVLEEYLYERHGVKILAAPNRPELAEIISADTTRKTLNLLRNKYKYTFVDTPTFIEEITLSALEMSDIILLIVSLDLTTVKNIKKSIDILHSLQLMHRTRLVLNRSSGVAGLEPSDVEKVLGIKIWAEVPSEGKLVVASINQGIPFMKTKPKSSVSKGMYKMLNALNSI